jgi:mRNA-degrading endonuclease toxin of MazEF toxin-antitoxin module
MKFGEVFICRFPFTTGDVSNPRPALVLFDLGLDVVICRITSGQRVGGMDISIADWKIAGLAKPSVARLNRLVTAEKTLLRTRIGELSTTDKQLIRDAWNAHMTL